MDITYAQILGADFELYSRRKRDENVKEVFQRQGAGTKETLLKFYSAGRFLILDKIHIQRVTMASGYAFFI